MNPTFKNKSLFSHNYVAVFTKKMLRNFQNYKLHLTLGCMLLLVINCKKEENCTLIADNCNGTIQDCECICNEGFIGENCKEEIIPENIKIDKIKLEGLFDACTNFDENDTLDYKDADVYFEIYQRDKLVFSSLPQILLNNYEGQTYILSLEDCYLQTPDLTYEMSFFDYDNGEIPDTLEKIHFTPYKKNENFPESITIHYNEKSCNNNIYWYNGITSVEIFLTYSF